MGQMTMYDHHASLSLDGRDPGYTLDDVDAVFDTEGFTTLKYSQTIYLPLEKTEDDDDNVDDGKIERSTAVTRTGRGKKSGALLAITPQLSGHVVGGCYWTLRRLSDDATIVLAPTYHHAKERHLAGSTLHKFGINADALVTAPGGPRGLLGRLYAPPPPPHDGGGAGGERNDDPYAGIIKVGGRGNKPILSPPVGNRSESELIEFVMAALRREGNVLLPVDASGRVIELLLILDRHWDRNRLSDAYNLCWVGPMCTNVIEYARSQLEWMAAPLGAQFDSQRGHPLALKCVCMYTSVSEMESSIGDAESANPTCVLASGATMDSGPARDLLLRWGGNPDNLVLLTDSTRCVPRGDVMSRSRRRPLALGGGGGTVAERDKSILMRTSSKEFSGGGVVVVEPDDAVMDDEVGNDDEHAAKFVGPALPLDSVSPYTTSSQLLYQWCAAKALNEEMPDEVVVDAYVPHRAPLKGKELTAFLAEEERELRSRKAEMEERAMMREIELARGRLRLGIGDGDGTVASAGGVAGAGDGVIASSSGQMATTSTTTNAAAAGGDASSSSRPKKKSRFDQALFIKFSKPVHMMFDIREEAVGIGQPDSVAKFGITESVGNGRSGVYEDDYGIAVKADSFIDIVTGVDPSKFAKSSGRIGEEVLRRGLGFGPDGTKAPVDSAGASAELVSDDGDRGDEAINEKMLEVADLSNGKGIIKGRNGRPAIKVSVIPRRLEVLAEVVYTPMEGRVDARAARQSVRALQPRHLVIIGGPRSNSLLLADALRATTITPASIQSKGYREKGTSSAHVTKNGETVKLSVGHAAYKVRLVDTPYLTKEEKIDVAEKEIETVQPYEAKIGDCTVSLVDFVATGKKWAVDGSIVLAPRRHQDTLNQPSLMLSTKEVLLTDLRAEVTALGMKAEYGALSGYSQLVVNGKIIIRKDNATGKLHVEGPLCSDFYSVRSVVCGQYVTI
ncbi:hypothetical protein ACHAXA_006903 [Cyclostephanos tholiformis]|uniref:Cleavage and polyadenylation specificity factor subunit 2 n=1 Tax=Cyclostephanos tholiformis TaxID=382380 RepID=A0ABD3SDL8_9STRA